MTWNNSLFINRFINGKLGNKRAYGNLYVVKFPESSFLNHKSYGVFAIRFNDGTVILNKNCLKQLKVFSQIGLCTVRLNNLINKNLIIEDTKIITSEGSDILFQIGDYKIFYTSTTKKKFGIVVPNKINNINEANNYFNKLIPNNDIFFKNLINLIESDYYPTIDPKLFEAVKNNSPCYFNYGIVRKDLVNKNYQKYLKDLEEFKIAFNKLEKFYKIDPSFPIEFEFEEWRNENNENYIKKDSKWYRVEYIENLA